MAELWSCPVCAGKVSSAAVACPHCGHPMDGGGEGPSPSPSAGVPGSEGRESEGGFCGCLVIATVVLGTIAFAFYIIRGSV